MALRPDAQRCISLIRSDQTRIVKQRALPDWPSGFFVPHWDESIGTTIGQLLRVTFVRAGGVRLVQNRFEIEPEGSRGSSAFQDSSTRDRAADGCYTSRIIKAGALLPDTKTLLSHWDLSESVQPNLQRLQRENVFGKASRSRVEDIVGIFRQRYLKEASVTRALVALVKMRLPASALDRILYFHAAKADRLLHDVVTEIVGPMIARGISDIRYDPSNEWELRREVKLLATRLEAAGKDVHLIPM